MNTAIKSIHSVGIDILAVKEMTRLYKDVDVKLRSNGGGVIMSLIDSIMKSKLNKEEVGLLIRLLGVRVKEKLEAEAEKVVVNNGRYMTKDQLDIAKGLCTGEYIL